MTPPPVMNPTPPRRGTPPLHNWPGWHGDRFPPAVRRAVLAAHPVCQGCGQRPSTQVDHRIPRAEGGPSTIGNAQALCDPCHGAKSDQEKARGHARRTARLHPATEGHPGLIDQRD